MAYDMLVDQIHEKYIKTTITTLPPRRQKKKRKNNFHHQHQQTKICIYIFLFLKIIINARKYICEQNQINIKKK